MANKRLFILTIHKQQFVYFFERKFIRVLFAKRMCIMLFARIRQAIDGAAVDAIVIRVFISLSLSLSATSN